MIGVVYAPPQAYVKIHQQTHQSFKGFGATSKVRTKCLLDVLSFLESQIK